MNKMIGVLALMAAFSAHAEIVMGVVEEVQIVPGQRIVQRNCEQYYNPQPQQYQQQYQNRSDTTGGQIMGGIVGGLLGSMVGGGTGQVAAAAVGAVAGSITGGNISSQQNHQNQQFQPNYYNQQPQQRCRDSQTNSQDSYIIIVTVRDSVYRFHTNRNYYPGNRVRVDVTVRLAE